jgi:soluble lytic murein transglycosylase-like protein
MQRRIALLICGFALCGGLSCAVREPIACEPASPPVAAASEPKPPDRADEIEALLARHLTGLAPFEVRRAAEAVIAEAERNRLDPALVLAVMHTESGYYNFARSPVGALGLMQIMPATGEMLAREAGIPWRGPDMLFEPALNLRLGTRYLAFLHARYGSWPRALAAYNWGPAAIDRRLAEGETLPVQYTDRVYSWLARP